MKLSYSPTGEDMQQRDNGYLVLTTNLLTQVLDTANIQTAWKQVRQNKGSAGIDGITIEQFPDWIRPQWHALKEQLRNGHYRPHPVKRVRIPKGDGTERLLGIPIEQQSACPIVFAIVFARNRLRRPPSRCRHGTG